MKIYLSSLLALLTLTPACANDTEVVSERTQYSTLASDTTEEEDSGNSYIPEFEDYQAIEAEVEKEGLGLAQMAGDPGSLLAYMSVALKRPDGKIERHSIRKYTGGPDRKAVIGFGTSNNTICEIGSKYTARMYLISNGATKVRSCGEGLKKLNPNICFVTVTGTCDSIIGFPNNRYTGSSDQNGDLHAIHSFLYLKPTASDKMPSNKIPQLTNFKVKEVKDASGTLSHYTVEGTLKDPDSPSTILEYFVRVKGSHVEPRKFTDKNQSFSVKIPEQYMTGRKHLIEVFAIDANTKNFMKIKGVWQSLLQEKSQKEANLPVAGSYTVSRSGVIQGTAVDGNDKNAVVIISVRYDNRGLLTIPAHKGKFKYELAKNEHLTKELMDGKKHTFKITAIDPQTKQHYLFGQSTITLNRVNLPMKKGTSTSHFAPQGYLDNLLTNGYFNGWALDKDSPNRSIYVEISIDNVKIGSKKANKMRWDVNKVMKVGGLHGYWWKIPTKYRDGKSHTLKVHAIDPITGDKVLLTNGERKFNLKK